jgi:hypothetical protein
MEPGRASPGGARQVPIIQARGGDNRAEVHRYPSHGIVRLTGFWQTGWYDYQNNQLPTPPFSF